MNEHELQNLPTIDCLKRQLNISDPGSCRVHPLFKSIGLHVDYYEAQHALLNEHGEVQFNTGVEFPDLVYRGQVQEFDPCVAGLGRLRHLEEKLLAVCRNVAFEDAIRAHPYVSYCAKQAFNGHPLHIGYQGLAQHYGFHTDMLDVTSNFDVATFFACCEWSAKEGRYLPVAFRPEPGVIYGVEPVLFSMRLLQGGAEFNFVGWQPLPRPAQQRAGAFILPRGQCFAKLPGMKKAYFRHDQASAEKVWRAFDGGKTLFPDDEAATLSRVAQDLCIFSNTQVERAWEMLERWEGRRVSEKHRKIAVKASGVQIGRKAPLAWTSYNVPSKPELLHARLNSELSNVRFRLTYYPPA